MVKRILGCVVALSVMGPTAIAAQPEQGLVTYRAMTPELALRAAQTAMEACRQADFQVSVAVVDRGGNVQVLLRDRFAGAHTPDTAIGKAWTAVSFRTNTTELTNLMERGELPTGLLNVPGVVVVGGGIKVEAAGAIVGGIGVSGSPSGEADEKCANAGFDSIRELIEF